MLDATRWWGQRSPGGCPHERAVKCQRHNILVALVGVTSPGWLEILHHHQRKRFTHRAFWYLAKGTFRWFLHHRGCYAFDISLRVVSPLRVAATVLLQEQSQFVLLAPPQEVTKQWSEVLSLPWTTSGPLSHEWRQQDFPRLSLDTRPNQRNWDLSIRSRSGSTFRSLRNSQLRTLSQSVKEWTLHKNPISAACTWYSVPQSLPKIHDHMWWSEQRPI